MRYVMKQKVIALTDQFTIRDESGSEVYKVKGKLISIGDRLSFQDTAGKEIALLKQELITVTPSFRVFRDGKLQADISKKLFTVLKDKFKVDMKDGSTDLEIKGSILEHEYQFLRGNDQVASVSKKWVSIGDSYGIDIDDGEDDVLILSCVIIVDMISHDSKGEAG